MEAKALNIDLDQKYTFSPRLKQISIGLIILGLVLGLIGFFTGGHGHEAAHEAGAHHGNPMLSRLWANILLNAYYFGIIGACGLAFIAIKVLSNAGWYVGLRRIPEAFINYIPVGLVTILLVGVFGLGDIYHWAHEGVTDPNSPNYDTILAGKSGFLNRWFYFIGLTVFFGVWYFCGRLIRQYSLNEDINGGLTGFKKSITIAAFFMFFFAFTFSATSWMVMMSIDAHWFSTMFSVNNFAIGWVGAISAITLITLYLKSEGYLSFINEEHLHDLGKMIFAFSIFWTYTWLAQYLLIWYANLPEETIYYQARLEGFFKPVFFLNAFLNFLCPLLILMTRGNKRNPMVLGTVAVIVFVGHWIDTYLMVMPGAVGLDNAGFGFMEIGFALAFLGLFIFIVFNSLSKAPLIAKNHPYLMESVAHETGV